MRTFRGGFVAPSLIFSAVLAISIISFGSSFTRNSTSSLTGVNISLESTLSRFLSSQASSFQTTSSKTKDRQSGEVTANAAQIAIVQDLIPEQIKQALGVPYSLTAQGVTADLNSLGYSLGNLRTQGIEVMGHQGLIPKLCASGPSGATTTYGIAIKTAATYRPCVDGKDPLYDAYRPAGYSCVVIYNNRASNKAAILAHELGHCLHFTHGQYEKFDIDYRAVRPVAALTTSQQNEITADDFMTCRHGLDTGWGDGGYYSRYGVAPPTAAECTRINTLINTHLIK